MRKKIRQILFDLGIPFNLRGFAYLEEALAYIIETDEKSFTQVCIEVGEEVFVSYQSVYGMIITAIKKINRNGDAWKRYVNIDAKGYVEVIYTLAFNIAKEIEDEQDISARDS